MTWKLIRENGSEDTVFVLHRGSRIWFSPEKNLRAGITLNLVVLFDQYVSVITILTTDFPIVSYYSRTNYSSNYVFYVPLGLKQSETKGNFSDKYLFLLLTCKTRIINFILYSPSG